MAEVCQRSFVFPTREYGHIQEGRLFNPTDTGSLQRLSVPFFEIDLLSVVVFCRAHSIAPCEEARFLLFMCMYIYIYIYYIYIYAACVYVSKYVLCIYLLIYF